MTCASPKSGSHTGTCNPHTLTLDQEKRVEGDSEVGSAWFPSPPGPCGWPPDSVWPRFPQAHPSQLGLFPPPAPPPPPLSLRSPAEREKKLGLSGELPASKRARRRFKPACRKTHGQSSAAATWGSENRTSTCRTHRRPGSGASLDGGPATSARAAPRPHLLRGLGEPPGRC